MTQHWLSADVVVNGVRLHYYRTGGGKAPLVLAHGSTDSGLCWSRVARELEADYDVIMPDARGHGLSDAPPGGYDASDHAADLAGLIRALDLHRPAVGGHSMGAMTALFLAAQYPDLVRCAFMEDPVFRLESTPVRTEAELAEWTQEMLHQKTLSREAVEAQGRAEHPGWHHEELGPWAVAKLQVSDAFATARRGRDYIHWRETLQQVECPLLLITGDPELGAIVTEQAARAAQKAQPRLEVVHIPGAEHNIRRDCFEDFVRAVRQFLSRNA